MTANHPLTTFMPPVVEDIMRYLEIPQRRGSQIFVPLSRPRGPVLQHNRPHAFYASCFLRFSYLKKVKELNKKYFCLYSASKVGDLQEIKCSYPGRR
jgi:hypothetical protein